MDCESRRELALKYIEKARKNIEKVYDVEHMQLYEPEAKAKESKKRG